MNLRGTYTTDNVRRSHVAAAARWDAQYVEITAAASEMMPWDVFWQKLMIPRLFPSMTQICLIDGDAIINASCPDLFKKLEPGQLLAVANLQDDQPPECAEVQEKVWKQVCNIVGFDLEHDPQTYINGGVIVADATTMTTIFDVAIGYAAKMCDAKGLHPLVEQTCVSLALMVTGRLTVLGPEFNRISRAIWNPNRPMGSYIEHLANINMGRERRNSILESIDWAAPIRAEQPVEVG